MAAQKERASAFVASTRHLERAVIAQHNPTPRIATGRKEYVRQTVSKVIQRRHGLRAVLDGFLSHK